MDATNFDREVLASGDELTWLNSALQPVWARLNCGIRRLIADELEPALQQKIPLVGRFLTFTEMTLGSVAPQLGPVTVTRSSNAVDFNVGIHYSGDLAVAFSAGVASIELVDVRIDGTFQVSLRPLVDALNPCGGITISCLDRPSIELTLRTGSELVPNLYDLVRNIVDDVVASLLVVPNGIAVPIATMGPETDGPLLNDPLPKGILRVTLQEISGSSEAPVSSPYVNTRVGAASWLSPIARTLDDGGFWATESDIKVWAKGGSTQDFVIYSPNQSVDMRVFQSDVSLDLDVLLGTLKVPVHGIGHGAELEVPLVSPEGADSGRRLHFKGDWLGVLEDPTPTLVAPSTIVSGASAPSRGSRSLSRASQLKTVGTAGAGDVEMLASVRVESVEGLPPDPEHRYSLRLAVDGGIVCESTKGHAPSMHIDQVNNEVLVQLAKKLAPLLPLADLADVLGVPHQLAREFAEQHASPFPPQVSAKISAAWDLDWCRRAREQAQRLAASKHPQFGRIFHLPVPRAAKVELELLRHRQGSSSPAEAIGLLTCDFDGLRGRPAACHGPFELALADGSSCTLHGSVQLRLLEPQGRQPADPLDALNK